MSPRRRRRSRRRTSRRSGPLSLLLVVAVVAGIGYLLIQRGVLPAPPGPLRQFPKVDGSADNGAAQATDSGGVAGAAVGFWGWPGRLGREGEDAPLEEQVADPDDQHHRQR